MLEFLFKTLFSGKQVTWTTGITSPVFLFFSLPQCLPREDCLLQQLWSTFLFSGCALHHRSPFILPFISLFICGNFHMWIFQAFCRTGSLLSGFHAMAFRPHSLRNTSQFHSLSVARTVALSYAGWAQTGCYPQLRWRIWQMENLWYLYTDPKWRLCHLLHTW